MTLVDKGLLDLDTDISEYLGYEVRNPRFPDTPITSRMLMQHLSSVTDSSNFHSSLMADEPKALEDLIGQSSSFKNTRPGTVFEYTNFGYSVLAAVCEKISGQMLDTLAQTEIFRKLDIDAGYVAKNLKDTTNIAVLYNYNHRPSRTVERQLEVVDSDGVLGHDHNLAQGGLIISPLDYSRLLVMLGNDGTLYNKKILSQEAVHEIHNTNEEGRGYLQGLSARFSPDVFSTGHDFYWHTGSAYGVYAQYIQTADETNKGIIIVTTGSGNYERLSNRMYTMCTDFSEVVWNFYNP